MVLQLKRQLCGAQSPPSHHPWREFMPAWGVAPGPVFQSFSGRWASPRRAVFVSLYTGVLCVRTLSAEPFWLSLCFDLCAYGQCE